MTLKELLERRSRVIADMRGITEKPEGQGGDLSEDQARRFDELRGDLAKTEKDIERAQALDEAERRMQGQPVTGSGDNRFDDECRSFSLLRAVASQVPDMAGKVDFGREREVSQELARRAGTAPKGLLVPLAVFEQRVMTSGGTAAGSNLIATDHNGQAYIDRLRAALRVRQMGATVLNGLVGNVDIPRLKDSAVSGWIAENQALTASDMKFDKTALSPKHVGALTEFSRNMLLQTSPDVETLVRNDFAAILAEAVDAAAIQGGGTNEPTGILGTNGISVVPVGTNGGALTYDLMADLVGEVDDANVQAATGFLTNSTVKRAASKLKDGQARPYGLDTVFQSLPRAFSNVVPSDLTKGTGTGLSAILYGNWADLLIGYWSAFDLLVNPYESSAYAKGNVQVRALLTCDIALRHAESFAVAKDVAA